MIGYSYKNKKFWMNDTSDSVKASINKSNYVSRVRNELIKKHPSNKVKNKRKVHDY